MTAPSAVPAGPLTLLLLRRRLRNSASLVLLGILTSAAVDSTLGGWITMPALAYLLWTLHRFGRAGPG